MRNILLHRRADRSLSRIPNNRATQIISSLEEVAALPDVLTHSAVKALSGQLNGKYRLRVGSYRIVFELRDDEQIEILFVNFIGPRGDAYR